jgi:hypothetical protein
MVDVGFSQARPRHPLHTAVPRTAARRALQRSPANRAAASCSIPSTRFAIIRTRWQTRPLSYRAKGRSSAAPVRCERSMPTSSIPQSWYACPLTLPHLWNTGSRCYISDRKVQVLRSAAPTATLTPPAQAVPAQRSKERMAGHSSRSKTMAAQRSGMRTGTLTPPSQAAPAQRSTGRERSPRRFRRESDRVALERDREFEPLSLHRRVMSQRRVAGEPAHRHVAEQPRKAA